VEYNVVFDVTQSGYRQWWFPAFGLIFVAVGSGMLFFRRRLPARTPRFFPYVFLGFAIVWTLGAFVGTLRDYLRLNSALREGRCEVIAGVVSDFHPMPFNGHQMEWFTVGDRRFQYSDFVVSAGFNNTASHGGPIHKGVQVRVHHFGNEIARLEVAR
jgi:hypothetical protein